LGPDPTVEEASRERLRFPPLILTEEQRKAVHAAIEETTQFRRWQISALNVRTNHVHVVVAAPNHAPELVLTAFKAYATRRLRTQELTQPDRPVWSRHRSTRYLWTERQIEDVCAYVIYGQD
jgi:REP element-mobilizing transposase RayT